MPKATEYIDLHLGGSFTVNAPATYELEPQEEGEATEPQEGYYPLVLHLKGRAVTADGGSREIRKVVQLGKWSKRKAGPREVAAVIKQQLVPAILSAMRDIYSEALAETIEVSG